ncbi:hypothetical protein D9757_014397 [Collybiopsis confluens]|uniref:valine--tRNA ligase n=1 Tax=Collybiopsis confluens TaxID=2823264 RepID=A0A8H5GAB2_9AGAR|nr:hypothetical protein D9757_014397 [Collybiopsis confluens]
MVFADPIEGSEERLTVATTRSEAMLGDTAIAAHQDNSRFRHLHTKFAVHPFIPSRRLSIVPDTIVNSGANFKSMEWFQAHVAVVKALQEKGLYIEAKDDPMQIPICRFLVIANLATLSNLCSDVSSYTCAGELEIKTSLKMNGIEGSKISKTGCDVGQATKRATALAAGDKLTPHQYEDEMHGSHPVSGRFRWPNNVMRSYTMSDPPYDMITLIY